MKKINHVIILIVLFLWIGFIFHNSMNNAVDSSASSSAVLEMANKLLAFVNLGALSEHTVRKAAHFTEFAIEGILLMLNLRVYAKNWKKQLAVPLLLGVLTALTDETIQLSVEGRSAQVTDVWIDTGGVAAGVVIMFFVLSVIRRNRASYE